MKIGLKLFELESGQRAGRRRRPPPATRHPPPVARRRVSHNTSRLRRAYKNPRDEKWTDKGETNDKKIETPSWNIEAD